MSEASQKRYRGMFSRPAPLLAVTTLVTAGLWALFVGSSNPHEAAVGVAVIALTIAFCRLMFRNATLPFEPVWRDMAEMRHIPANLFVDCWAVLRVLAKDFAGKPPEAVLQAAPFVSSRHDPERIQRAVLAIAYMTMTPNSIVIGVDPARSLILYHQLERTTVPSLVTELGGPR